MPARGLELLALVGDLVEQSRVLDREHRLRGKRLHQVDHRLREQARFAPPDREHADDLFFEQQRHREQRSVPAPLEDHTHPRDSIAAFGEHVGHLNRRPQRGRLTGSALAEAQRMRAQHLQQIVLDRACATDPTESLGGFLVFIEDAAARAGKMHGARNDRVEHGVDVEARAHGASDLAQRMHLLERAPELARACLHLLLERRARRGELGRRAIELVAERFQLVTGRDGHAMIEIAGADACRTRLQRTNRGDHAAREKPAGEQRERKAQQENHDAAHDRLAQRRVSIGRGPLDEHEPSLRRDHRVRGEHAAAAEAVRKDRRGGRIPLAGKMRTCALHLGKTREIAPLAQRARVRMRDELVARIDDVRICAGPDREPGHDSLQRAQTHLGGRDFDRVRSDRHRQDQVRLGIVAQANGTPVDLSRPRGDELRRLREVHATGDGVGVQARYVQLLVTRHVDVTQVADRRNATQHAQEIELALLGDRRGKSFAKAERGGTEGSRRRIVRRGARRVAHLLLHLAQELLDARGRRRRVRLLDVDDRPLCLPVGEVKFREAG